jgi:hypothetical protein
MSGFASFAMINLDSEDPAGLASFYSAVLGWNVLHSEAEYAMIGDGSINIGFGKVPGYTAPGWPEESGPKRYHPICMLTILTKQSNKRSTLVPASRPSSLTPIGGAYCWIRAVIPLTSV